MIEEKIVGTPSGVDYGSFDILLYKFKLGLVMIMICVSKCEGT